MNAEEKYKGFTFIIPTYNAAKYLERCLKSIRDQDYDQKKVEILVIDGGSGDNTLEIAGKFACKVLNNPRRLAEYGVQLGIQKVTGDFLVVFAADNELVGSDWLKKVMGVFSYDKEVSAVWGKLASGKEDSSLNKYFELIQSDPLNWFLNKNLRKYRDRDKVYKNDYFIFLADPRIDRKSVV